MHNDSEVTVYGIFNRLSYRFVGPKELVDAAMAAIKKIPVEPLLSLRVSEEKRE